MDPLLCCGRDRWDLDDGLMTEGERKSQIYGYLSHYLRTIRYFLAVGIVGR